MRQGSGRQGDRTRVGGGVGGSRSSLPTHGGGGGVGGATLGELGILPHRVASETEPYLPKAVTSSGSQYCTLQGLPILAPIHLSALTPVSGGRLPRKRAAPQSSSQTLLSGDPKLKEDGRKEAVGGSSHERERAHITST